MWGPQAPKGPPQKVIRDFFKEWSDARGVTVARKRLSHQPRPWLAFHQIHSSNHLLQDRNCATIIDWCRDHLSMETDAADRRRGYLLSHDVHRVMSLSHKPANLTREALFRMCAENGDVTSAYKWFNYYAESGQPQSLVDCAWLLKAASRSPSDSVAEEMGLAVHQLSSNTVGPEYWVEHQTDSLVDVEAKRSIRRTLLAMAPRLEDPVLLEVVDAIRTSLTPELLAAPVEGDRFFLTSELPVATLENPHLNHSILHRNFQRSLLDAALSADPKVTLDLIDRYKSSIAQEKSLFDKKLLKRGQSAGSIFVDTRDKDFYELRKNLLGTASGGSGDSLTPELYHYLLVCLANGGNAGVALQTFNRMKDVGLRPLDLTSASLVVALDNSTGDQVDVASDFEQEFAYRRQLDSEKDTKMVFAANWEYDYVSMIHHRNALSRERFYSLVGRKVGPAKMQEIAFGSKQRVGGSDTTTASQMVLVDDEMALALEDVLIRWTKGEEMVAEALDFVANECPSLDVALMGRLQHFDEYALAPSRQIAHSRKDLQQLFGSYTELFLVDASFIESSDAFATTLLGGTGSPAASKRRIIVPYSALRQLNETLNEPQPLDSGLREDHERERAVATLRMVQLKGLIKAGLVEVLHFSEALMAHGVDLGFPCDTSGATQAELEDHQTVRVSCLLSAAFPKARVAICSNDPAVETLVRSSVAFKVGVEVCKMQLGDERVAADREVTSGSSGLTAAALDDVLAVAEDFSPELEIVHEAPINKDPIPEVAPAGENKGGVIDGADAVVVAKEEEDAASSPWLDALEDVEEDSELDGKMVAASEPMAPVASDSAESEFVLEEELGFFSEFKSLSPERREELRAPKPFVDPRERKKHRRAPELIKEFNNQKPISIAQKRKMARSLSNYIGAKVPGSLQYKRVKANVNDPRNRGLVKKFQKGLRDKKDGPF